MKRINWNEFIWFGILLGFSVYLYHLLITGEILYFVHPRSIKFSLLTMFFFFVLTIFQVKRITQQPKRPVKLGYLMFILPLLLGATAAPKGITEEIAVIRGINVAAPEQREGFSLFDASNLQRIDYVQDDILVIDDVFFDDALNEIKGDLDKYQGQRVSLYGFVHRQDHFDENTFFISRMLLACCAADALITGILGEYEGIDAFDEYDWVEVTGVIHRMMYYDPWVDQTYEAPLVRIEHLQGRERPTVPYVYPRDYAGPQH